MLVSPTNGIGLYLQRMTNVWWINKLMTVREFAFRAQRTEFSVASNDSQQMCIILISQLYWGEREYSDYYCKKRRTLCLNTVGQRNDGEKGRRGMHAWSLPEGYNPILVWTYRQQAWSPLKTPSTEMPLLFMGVSYSFSFQNFLAHKDPEEHLVYYTFHTDP